MRNASLFLVCITVLLCLLSKYVKCSTQKDCIKGPSRVYVFEIQTVGDYEVWIAFALIVVGNIMFKQYSFLRVRSTFKVISGKLSITHLGGQIPAGSRIQSKKSPGNHASFSTTAIRLAFSHNRMTGVDYMRSPHLNKGLAFTYAERQMLGIHGLLAADYKTQEEQVAICELSFDRYHNPLNKYLYLSELQDQNARLFYSLLATDVEKFLPIVYTPTVGLACQKFGFIYKQTPKGLFLSITDKGRLHKILKHWPISDVYAIVVSDGERILGLGDLGAFGMGIPVGKLNLYTALAGIKPHRCLPVLLDVGCDTESLLMDPLYIGLRQKRCRGKEYEDFVQEFMEACIHRFGRNVLIQFEDFARDNAVSLLQKYRRDYCTFNDDIQGTAAITIAGIITAAKITKRKISDNVFFFFGAGAAGAGIANLLVLIMMEEKVSRKECLDKIFLFDVDGLVTSKRPEGVPNHLKEFAKPLEIIKDFAKAVATFKPTCLIGTSTMGGAFTHGILRQLGKNCERPLIFALSNPTSKAECTAQEAYDMTEGRCIFASGSPFPPVQYGGKEYKPGQGNNSYIFPGLCLGVITAQLSVINDDLFLTAAKVIAENVTEDDIKIGRIFPALSRLKEVSVKIAYAVAHKGYDSNIACVFPKPKNIEDYITSEIYNLKYPSFLPEFYDYPDTSKYRVGFKKYCNVSGLGCLRRLGGQFHQYLEDHQLTQRPIIWCPSGCLANLISEVNS